MACLLRRARKRPNAPGTSRSPRRPCATLARAREPIATDPPQIAGATRLAARMDRAVNALADPGAGRGRRALVRKVAGLTVRVRTAVVRTAVVRAVIVRAVIVQGVIAPPEIAPRAPGLLAVGLKRIVHLATVRMEIALAQTVRLVPGRKASDRGGRGRKDRVPKGPALRGLRRTPLAATLSGRLTAHPSRLELRAGRWNARPCRTRECRACRSARPHPTPRPSTIAALRPVLPGRMHRKPRSRRQVRRAPCSSRTPPCQPDTRRMPRYPAD